MLCAISKSKLEQLSLWFPDTCLKTRLEKEWANVLGWLPKGSWTLNIPLSSPSTFTCRHTRKQAQTPFCWRGFPASISFYMCVFLLLSLLFTPVFLSLSFFLSIYITVSHSVHLLYLSVALLYTCAQTHKSQLRWSACAADLPLIVRQPRWAFRATAFFSDQMTHGLIGTIILSSFLPPSSAPRGKRKLSEKGLGS